MEAVASIPLNLISKSGAINSPLTFGLKVPLYTPFNIWQKLMVYIKIEENVNRGKFG